MDGGAAMSKLHDLIAKVENPSLRDALAAECRKLEKGRKFGLVFEEHLPEATPLYDLEIKPGMNVATRVQDGGALFIVKAIEDGVATCIAHKGGEEAQYPLDELVAVATFGEPIYPYLKMMDSIENGGGDLWHTLIEADNYHALQLLEYLYAGKVDCIYIDPPYNTGARDWKYNNDYVDSNDAWRHSKWLSMMEKRLKLAKKLLNPKDSVLIVTIDEKEYLHLGMLLEQLFPEARMQMVSSVINSAGVTRGDEFSRSNEYLFFLRFGSASPVALPLSDEWRGHTKSEKKDALVWNQLMRSGTGARRVDRPNMFYPLFISDDGTKIVKVGNPLPPDVSRETIIPISGTKIVWPIRSNGEEGRWRIGANMLENIYQKGYVRLGAFTDKGMALTYLANGEQQKVESGVFTIIGRRDDGSIIEGEMEFKRRYIPGTQWDVLSHNATYHGSQLLPKILGNRFSFPKSLYAVHDAIRFFVANKPNALILDFFAGSGTTLHAVNLLNAEDGGNRRCIMVTNNEVSDAEAKEFQKKGLRPGDQEWESKGIARYVTWPRTVCSIKGVNIKGEVLKGDYLGGDKDNPRKISDGFKANAAFFKLGFLNPGAVALGRKFEELLPVLWMKAGAHGECPKYSPSDKERGSVVWPENKMAVLFDEGSFAKFAKEVRDTLQVETIFVVTDYEPSYRAVVEAFPKRQVFSLYSDYLTSFRVNVKRG
jgi:adenine-specific DNA-methyltransferase